MDLLKVDIIIDAYDELRISGITVDPTPRELEYALKKLEMMAAEWSTYRNVCTGYHVVGLDADPNDIAGIDFSAMHAMATNLAVRLVAAFGKTVPPTLMAQASQSFSGLSTTTATVNQTQYPDRQPVGSGNGLRLYRWQRYYRKQPLPPISCETQQISQNEVNDYNYSFGDYLEDLETIDSYTYTTSNGLTVESESLTDDVWSYRLNAASNAATLERAQINVTTSLGREQSFTINFNVEEVPEVP